MVDRSQLKDKLYVTNEYGVTYQNPVAVLTQEEVDFAAKEWGINTNLHRTCINCQIRQMLKYESFTDSETQEKHKKFSVPCKGIPKGMPKGTAAALDSMVDGGMKRERALLLLQSQVDPVAWAELMFGFSDSKPTDHIRSYQKEQLRCSSRRIVIREGRRAGKTFIVALKLLYFIFNRTVATYDNEGNEGVSGPLVMIVTPYQSQLINVFNEMERLLKRNKDLIAAVTTASADSLYVKTPYFHMDFKNGGSISGFVSGVGTKVDGSGGGTIRGQSAHIIYLDEMDMIPEETLEKAVLPILLSDLSGDVTLIATSTPIGKRGRFYKWCLDDPTFKEDHLPSTVLPQWPMIKAMITADATDESLKTEYMAMFVDGSYGCFKPSYVYRSRKEYTYDDTHQLSWWQKHFSVTDSSQYIRCIGIDWNKNAGTEFVVTTYIPHVHRYIVTEAVNIPAGEFSALRWQEELIRLNYIWKPDYIYADEGYGHTIIENLRLIAFSLLTKEDARKTAQDFQTVKLSERLKSFNFSGKVSLRNPIDGTPIEKQGKDFLVETAQRVFEDPGRSGEGIVWFPDNDKQLKDELLHYRVLRRSPTTNRPVYGTDSERVGDHRLDAFMLSIAGIQIEAGLYSGMNILTSQPVFVPKEVLEYQPNQTVGEELLNHLEKNRFVAPGKISVLQILREGESPEQAASRNHRGQRITRREGKDEPAKLSLYEQFKNLKPVGDPETMGGQTIERRIHNRDRTIHRRRR